MSEAKPPLVDRDFAEKFFRSVDRPLEYGVYFLFHEWWEKAPQSAIDAYQKTLHEIPGATEFLAERHLPEPLALDRLEACAPGTLGHAYRAFIVDNGLEANLARNYKTFHEQLKAEGKLDRLPDDLAYTIVRGFQLHDFLHVIAGFDPSVEGELSQAMFHLGQLRFPYHAIRLAVTTSYLAFLDPASIERGMDALVAGWIRGRAAKNLHFIKWEDELDTPLESVRDAYGIDLSLGA